ncbi:Acg family FMN-binding oxidoreductase [Mycobacterium nebraskense]|uniref:NAD(P)H nitroreductase n=1 Tax=Mycobacterium nebraskense TaxID=244292 RepID=A0A0F5NDQ0_9MYCO|nr:NAD(P)H nitroreductase [Mycobacterium nebraskense]KKC05027.1 NAD(P)H nitroreductase [Mycobacterium nebraskense]KLO33861.1 NAD(P)H nitroreductase [Mycobacterium nebraskense]MBI2695192.1 NAD(P)H nitroreductase [Mycobacterium nebraskense]MCV7118876.1 NAD(P)H nitroreductase [Mycobacterium nebraskense]ORW20787.1 NAD(P)H nitroreductase [Mycobacterium nebraskense]
MPAAVVDTELIEDVVRSACRAPSLHNSQPWLWVAGGGRLELFLDASRAMVSDRSGREAVISCGAALDHLRVALAAAGRQAGISRFPDPKDPNHLASVDFTPVGSVTDADRRRASAIWARRTDRLPFIAPMNFEALEQALRDAIDNDAVHLDVMADDVRDRLARASWLAESLRLYDNTYQNELHWWTTPFEGAEGVPYSSLLSAAESERVDIGRTFPMTHNRERRTQVPEDESTILMLSTDDDTRLGALLSGEALSAVLLECTMANLATCPVTHVTELKVTREMIADLLEEGRRPQVLVRVGVAPALAEPPRPTPRRPLSEVLRVEG